MIRLVMTDQSVMAGLPLANPQQRALSKAGRRELNHRLQQFKADFGYMCKTHGKQVAGRAAVIWAWVVARVDADAPLKAVQDASAPFLFVGGDDRAIRCETIAMRRTSKGRVRDCIPALRPCIVVEAYAMPSESSLLTQAFFAWSYWSAVEHAWIDRRGWPRWPGRMSDHAGVGTPNV